MSLGFTWLGTNQPLIVAKEKSSFLIEMTNMEICDIRLSIGWKKALIGRHSYAN